ncbi:MAG: hypothetical protein NVS3B25_09900 [Hymenobacter sp.]
MAETKVPNLTFAGLWTSANPFSKTPDGAMEIADNIILRNPSLVEPRRGYTQSSANPSGTNQRVYPWNGRLMVFSAGGDLRDFTSSAGIPGGGVWSSAYGNFSPPDASTPIRLAAAGKSLFWTTPKGVKVLDTLGGTPQDVGLPAPYKVVAGSTVGGASWFNNQFSVAYCAVLCRFDANGALIQGPPSSNSVVTNLSGTSGDGNCVVYLPLNLQGATFIQIYRTKQVLGTPTSEFFLVAEHTITAADISATNYTLSDDPAPDTFLTVPLYTNGVTGSGSGATNDLPPLARDLCLEAGRLLYANTTSRHAIRCQLYGTAGLGTSTTISVGGVTLTGSSPNVVPTSPTVFYVYTNGTPSQNVETTARSICDKLTGAASGVTALYTSTASDAPGKFTIYETGIGGSGFTLSSSSGFPNLVPDISTAGASRNSDNNRQVAALWWSNIGLPWGVNLLNYVIVGDPLKAILRVVNVRSVTFIFKEDGLWRMDGFDANGLPIISPFDPSCILLSPESINVLDNQVFAFTLKGYVAVNASGVTPAVSKPIERDLSVLQGGSPAFVAGAFGVSYEYEGLTMLCMPTGPTDTGAGWQYVFNEDNPSWTRWLLPSPKHGIYNPVTRALAWCVGPYIWEERATFQSTDIQDPPTAANPTGAITSTIKFQPMAAGDALYDKRFLETYWDFKTAEFTSASVGFDTDRPNTTVTVPITGPALYAWGTFPWGNVPWAQASRDYVARANMPQAMVQASRLRLTLTVTQALAFWQLQGFGYRFEATTETLRR